MLQRNAIGKGNARIKEIGKTGMTGPCQTFPRRPLPTATHAQHTGKEHNCVALPGCGGMNAAERDSLALRRKLASVGKALQAREGMVSVDELYTACENAGQARRGECTHLRKGARTGSSREGG